MEVILTERERQVVTLVVQGRCQKTIATRLGISTRRVRQIVEVVAHRIDEETERPSLTIARHFGAADSS